MVNKNKILFLVQLPPPIHGASLMNLSIKKSSLINKRFNTSFFNISAADQLTDVGKFSFLKLLKFFNKYLKVLKIFILNKPDLVYLTLSPHGISFYKDSIFAILAKFFGVKLLYHLHGKGIHEVVQNNILKKTLYKVIFKNVDVIILSPSLSFDIKLIRDLKSSLFYLPNGISPVKITKDICGNKEFIRMIYLSNYVPSKGALKALKAFNKVFSTFKNVRLDMYGAISNQRYYDSLSQYIYENNLSSVVSLNGGIYGDEKYRKLADSDIFIFPTVNECFPLSIIEAMMCGLSIVSTNVGAIPEIVQKNECGLLSEPESLDCLTHNLLKLVVDENFRNDLSKNSLNSFNNKYTFEVFEYSLINILNRSLK